MGSEMLMLDGFPKTAISLNQPPAPSFATDPFFRRVGILNGQKRQAYQSGQQPAAIPL